MISENTRLRSVNPLVIALMIAMAIISTSAATAADKPAQKDKAAAKVSVGRSTVIEAPWPVTSVSVAEPNIADVQVVSPNQVVVVAKSVGTTDLVLWNDKGEVWHTELNVDMDIAALQADLNGTFDGAMLRVSQNRDILVVKGVLRRVEDAAGLKKYMDASGLKYVDMTSVAGVQQVMIHVRVAEASRQAMRSLGINAVHAGDDFFGASTIGQNANNIDIGVLGGVPAADSIPFTFNSATSVSSAVTLFGGFPSADLQLFLQALVDNRYMRLLAEPTLVALSGEEASFLAGGEFPIPIVQGTSAGGGTTITVEFKEFGIRLRFRPTVLGDGRIRLKVAPEVSDLSEVGAVQIEGFSIPSILTRRAETTLEMNSGQTFALAGLIDRSVSSRGESVPGLGELPVLGSLFRSVRYQRDDTELVVLATVELVNPISTTADRPLPGDLHDAPSDWELYAEGRIEGRKPAKLGKANAQWLRDMGLYRLKGEGAWQPYVDEPGPRKGN